MSCSALQSRNTYTSSGSYVLRDVLQLATPPPHPSEAPIVNPNPLATTPTPPTSGVKVSLTVLNPRRTPSHLYNIARTSNGSSDRKTYSIKESDKEGRTSVDLNSESDGSTTTPAFGLGNVALAPASNKEPLKRRKPKNSIIKSNSSFVSRVIPHDGLAKRLTERDTGGLLAFANINRAYQWLDFSAGVKSEPLAKILFTKAHMLCHDVNSLTKSTTHIDVIMGSSAGDIIWYEPMSQKYARINKNGSINNTPVSFIKWIPGSENLFLASHMDGTLVVYDKEKEDSAFFVEEMGHDDEVYTNGDNDDSILDVTKSVNSANQKTNPVACWKISQQMVNQFAFSPDSRHLAVVSEDGCLRIIDYLQERYVLITKSTYDSAYLHIIGSWTCIRLIMAASRVCVGLQMACTS